MHFGRGVLVAAFVAWAGGAAPCAQDVGADVADIASREVELVSAEKDAPTRTYFLIGPHKGAKPPGKGHALLVILPGGNGSREFHPFIKRIFKHAVGRDFVVAQPVAIEHAQSRQNVWPTSATPGLKAGLATEAFVEDVIADAAGRVPIDRARIYLMAWSSSGPAAYAISFQKKKSVTGFFICMSVFKPDWLPSPEEAKGEAYVIEHSPDDKVCPFAMAKDAEKRLAEAGAKVNFVTTSGDHGWSGNVYLRMREGLAWLEKNHSLPDAGAKKGAGAKEGTSAKKSGDAKKGSEAKKK